MMRDRTPAALIAEAFGTFLFFFVGAGSVVLGDYLTANGGTGASGISLELAPRERSKWPAPAPVLGRRVPDGRPDRPSGTMA